MNKIGAILRMRLFTLLFLISIIPAVTTAQVSGYISSVTTDEAIEKEPLKINAEVLQTSAISNIRIAYKSFEESEFIIADMEFIGSMASFVIPSEKVALPFVTYYLIIDKKDGTVETYPQGIPEMGKPIEVEVAAKSEKDQEVLVLSPAKGETVALDDLFISVSLVRASENVNSQATKIYLNGEDISDKLLFAGDLILFYANNFPGTATMGSQSLLIELYDNEGELYHAVKRNFVTVEDDYFLKAANRFKYKINMEGESRNENFDKKSKWFNNFSTSLQSTYKDWQFNGQVYLTSEEDDKTQPQHRFSATIENDWLKVKAGDSYPYFPSLIMSGKRVRGVSGGLYLDYFNIEAAFGEIAREIEGSLLQTYSRADAPLGSNIIEIDSAKYNQPFGQVDMGIYSRELFIVRPSFGSGENFQLGFTYLHAKDDMKSIEFGARPEENAVIGTDLKVAVDDQNIILTGQAAVSLFNSDISSGTLSDSKIDSVFGEDSYFNADTDMIKRIKNTLSKFITVNQFIGPINPQELSSLGAEAQLQMNYFNNNLKASYIYRGNDYRSFGQDFIRTDVKGFNLFDRVRLMENKLFLTAGYERLEDNLQETKPATTIYQTLNTSVSYFPRSNFPNITVGYSRFKNDNGITEADTNKAAMVNDITNRFYTTLSYGFDYGVKHNSSLSFMTSTREDDSPANYDANYFSTSFSLNSYWKRNLTSFFSLMYYASDLAGKEYNYTTLSFGGKYKLMEDKLELSASLSPSFGDFKRQALDFVAQYLVMQNLRLIFQTRLYRIPDEATNSITGLTVRYRI